MAAEASDYSVEHVREALATDERVNELGLDVAVRNGRVYVSGTVSTEARRAGVTEVVREVCPDLEVHNETVLVDLAGSDMETL